MDEYRFTLYVAGSTTRSREAIGNCRRLCEAAMAGVYQLEIIDIVEDPAAAESGRILTTPTLIRETPSPRRRITGDLSNAEQVLIGLALQLNE